MRLFLDVLEVFWSCVVSCIVDCLTLERLQSNWFEVGGHSISFHHVFTTNKVRELRLFRHFTDGNALYTLLPASFVLVLFVAFVAHCKTGVGWMDPLL